MKTDIFKILNNDSDLRALLYSDHLRVYPLVAPASVTYPFVRYQTISAITYNLLQGGYDAAKLNQQLDIFSKSYSELYEVFNVLKEALENECYFDITAEDYDDESYTYRLTLELSFIV